MRDPAVENVEDQYDSPLERLQLLGEDDAAIAAFSTRSTSGAPASG